MAKDCNIKTHGRWDDSPDPIGDLKRGLELAKDTGIIPKMTHPLSPHWRQPSTDNILIDETCAVMEQATFDKLSEYSWSLPTGVYEGKMWKAQDRSGRWSLRWFGVSEKENHCSNNQREILIIT